MTNDIHPEPSSVVPAADLIDLEVGSGVSSTGESAIVLHLHLEKADGIHFRQRFSWDLLVGRDDLEKIVRKLQDALE
ncbi:MAG: hypothetical protein F4103_14705 [Boseongicola sp. SB0673_bin_14]|nr:hypothetical protein [Boseongicola sp. SB0667_bin_21]MYI69927.1 hypothetical protein [Boseongicola sp. SB0673_bin_14]